jgi:hypothetical protein
MRKFMMFGVLCLLLTVLSVKTAAADSLTCDCTPTADGVTSFQVQVDAGAWVTSAAVLTCGTQADKVVCVSPQKTLCYDLSALPAGSHVFKARAVNPSDVSVDSLPFTWVKYSTPTSPSLLKVVK